MTLAKAQSFCLSMNGSVNHPYGILCAAAFTRLGSAPKHHLTDSALAVRLLRADAPALLSDSAIAVGVPRQSPLLGALFESLVTLGILVYPQSAEAEVGHLRTRDADHEVDLIVQRDDHRVVALEVKLAPQYRGG